MLTIELGVQGSRSSKQKIIRLRVQIRKSQVMKLGPELENK